jgi:pyruvate,water dikinase
MVEGKQWIFWLNELNQHDRPKVGRKCANLGEMINAGLPVPPGYALGVDAYTIFFAKTNLDKEISEYLKKCDLAKELKYSQYQEISRHLRQLIEEQEMPAELANIIKMYYRELAEQCQVENVPVAVRSSGPISMPGQFETYLNVRKEENVVRQIIRCWASTFTTQALAYRLQRGMDIVSPIGVAVLKMVNAKSSGVAFTIHPTTGEKNKIVVEGSWGLGESVVGGDIAPDRFIVDKKNLKIDATINCKAKQIVYSQEGTCETEVPLELQNQPCLEQEELMRLVCLARRLEEYYGVAQDIEWAIDQDLPREQNLLLVQTRPVSKIIEHKEINSESIADMMVRNVFSR